MGIDTTVSMDIARDFLRIFYANNPTGLRAKWQEVAASALDQVVLTNQSFEGGSHGGELVFPRIALLSAIQDVMREMDPTLPTGPSCFRYADFGSNWVQV
ncbi:MAG: hypothetical protein K0R17_2756 [Rariglobus sp.]|jgi:hypothetical protein|nr:hypothetical protein [Rariglobus sp.]